MIAGKKILESGELYEHYSITVDNGQSPLRIDKFLLNRIDNVSRNKIQNAVAAECIFVNDKTIKNNYKVKPGDFISIVFPEPPRDKELKAEDIPINVLYEDDSIIIVNKEAGMVVHPAYANYTGTLVNAILFHFNNLPRISEVDHRAGLVHRIDKDTSGILVIAKTDFSLSFLAKQFFTHSIDRKYFALVWGDMENESGTIEANIGRHPKDRKKMHAFKDKNTGKDAITHYKVLERFGYTTLVECELETGRTHQIRAHMSFIGHPVFNDESYGGNQIRSGPAFTKFKQFIDNCFKILPRQALHAKSLGFVHPETKEKVFFDSELPVDMLELIDKWRKYSSYK